MLKRKLNNKAQTILEYTFCMLVVMLMLWGTMRVFRWVGVDLSSRRKAHDDMLVAPGSSQSKVYPVFSKPIAMNAIWGGN